MAVLDQFTQVKNTRAPIAITINFPKHSPTFVGFSQFIHDPRPTFTNIRVHNGEKFRTMEMEIFRSETAVLTVISLGECTTKL
ncbi:hypothetical protein D0894_03455 [Pseudomonas monteilii]|uniref:Uncharacterized protein n=1 Tax=Pseudomonas monteilii TaxID=76759 RepID=A0A399MCD7_9PSED|nr:hypothetical protein D0894_03455 [Pseudomonas monteilii]